jgi:serine protease Do
MSGSTFSRAKFGGALVGAFLGGLVIASGFDLTSLGHAQQARQVSRLSAAPAPVVNAPAVTELNTAFTSIAEHVTPGVVSIQAERRARPVQQRGQRRNNQQQPGIEDFFGQLQPQFQEPTAASGSGFIVTKDGYILTNNHVVENFDRVSVILTDNRTFPAKVIGRDPTTDVAVIKIDANNLPTVSLGDDEAVKIGEWVLAIGSPLGLRSTVTAGIVSAKGRGGADIGPSPNGNRYAISDFIQTDAAINPGNSGGPLVNIQGQVIGINSMIASQTGYYSGYGFAIPISLAKSVMDDIVEHGRVRRAMLGVGISDVTPEDAEVAGLKEITGVKIGDFTLDDSPAKKAGMESGDVILKADGKPADRVSTLQRIIRLHAPGDVIDIDAMRYGQKKAFHVRLGEVPDSAKTVASRDGGNDNANSGKTTTTEKLGIGVEPLSDQAAAQAPTPVPANRRGLVVVDVDPDGAGRNHFAHGDVLVSVRYPTQQDLKSPADLQQALSKVPKNGIVSLLVYNMQTGNARVENVKVGN